MSLRQYTRPEAEVRYTKLVQEYDKDLYVKWIWEKERWGIFSKGKAGKEYLIFTAETPEGGYRNIDRRDIITIAEADLQTRNENFSLANDILGQNEAHEEQQYKQLSDNVRAISKERWRNVMENPVVGVL